MHTKYFSTQRWPGILQGTSCFTWYSRALTKYHHRVLLHYRRRLFRASTNPFSIVFFIPLAWGIQTHQIVCQNLCHLSKKQIFDKEKTNPDTTFTYPSSSMDGFEYGLYYTFTQLPWSHNYLGGLQPAYQVCILCCSASKIISQRLSS